MKKIVACLAFVLSVGFFQSASAQFTLSSNNTSEQPKWAPPGQNHAEYYYLPDIDTYYFVPRKQFIYQSGGYWTFSSSLPKSHKGYNLYSANKVVINEPGAYRYYAEHKAKYASSPSNASVQKTKPASTDN